MPAISCSGLGVTYGDGTCALERIDLELEPGSFTVLVGASGAGKSTLLRCLNGLVRPTTGTVAVDGRRVDGGRDLRLLRRRSGMVFQMHQLIGRQSAWRNVLMGRLGHHPGWRTVLPLPCADAELALRCLERVDLLEKARSRCDQLSGGQRQRVAIARSLCQQPEILLADEPVASLDPATAVEVLDLMRRICVEDGLTAVVSLHQVDLARRYAQRVVGIARGRVVHDGDPASLDDRVLERIYHRISRPATGPVVPSSLPSNGDLIPCAPQPT